MEEYTRLRSVHLNRKLPERNEKRIGVGIFKHEFRSSRGSRHNCHGCCHSRQIVSMGHLVAFSSVHDFAAHGLYARMVCVDTGIQCMSVAR